MILRDRTVGPLLICIMMPRRRRVAYEAEVAARIRVRGAIGRLSNTLVQPRTLRRYSQMVGTFTAWLRTHNMQLAIDLDQLDFQLCE